jgi:hypothetical protein
MDINYSKACLKQYNCACAIFFFLKKLEMTSQLYNYVQQLSMSCIVHIDKK